MYSNSGVCRSESRSKYLNKHVLSSLFYWFWPLLRFFNWFIGLVFIDPTCYKCMSTWNARNLIWIFDTRFLETTWGYCCAEWVLEVNKCSFLRPDAKLKKNVFVPAAPLQTVIKPMHPIKINYASFFPGVHSPHEQVLETILTFKYSYVDQDRRLTTWGMD